MLSTLSKRTVRRLYTEGGTYVPSASKLVINWGFSGTPSWGNSPVQPLIWNKTPNVRIASNKLTAFQAFQTAGIIEIPEFTTDIEVSKRLVGEGKVIVCRTSLNGHSGAGIVVAAREEDLVAAPLYTVYRKKKKEYRVHVAFGRVIDVQQKRKRVDFDGDTDYAVRNHHTGWVYCREDVDVSEARDNLAVRAVVAVGLDFGAVDIIYNEYSNSYILLEVNTAPGLEGTTVEKYSTAFTEALSQL